jgi:hypothetical protein
LEQPSITETKAFGPSARGSGRRSNFSISGKETSICGTLPPAQRVEHLRQPVQGLRAEHQVDVGRALADRLALLARHAAADADHQLRARCLPGPPAAELREDLLLRLLADGAGIQQQDVRILRPVGQARCRGMPAARPRCARSRTRSSGSRRSGCRASAPLLVFVASLPVDLRARGQSTQAPRRAHHGTGMSSEPVYKVIFQNGNQVLEVFARQIYQSDMWGFIEVEEFLFGERSKIVVDPGEEKLKNEFSAVKRSYIPLHSVIRIDEVAKEGVARVSDVKPGDKTNVTSFPMPTVQPTPPGSE